MEVTSVTLNLTRRCNLNCGYCFNWRKSGTEFDMSKDIAFKSVDFVFNQNKYKLDGKVEWDKRIEFSLWGGEPLLRYDLIKDIVKYVNEKNSDYGFSVVYSGTTNGTLLTEDKFDFLDEHKIMFMISLDGTKETHDRYRGQWDVIVKNAEKVLQRWPFYKVRISPYPERIGYFYNDVKFLVEMGFTDIMYSPVYELNWTEEVFKVFAEQQQRIVEDIVIPEFRKGRKIRLEHLCTYSNELSRDWKFPCGAGKQYVGIDFDGAIYPCHRFIKFDDSRNWNEKEYCLGHIDKGITNKEFREFFIKPVEWKECRECEMWDRSPCYGGCYAVVWDFLGKLTEPFKPVCLNAKTQKSVSDWFVRRLKEEGLVKRYFMSERVKPVFIKDLRPCICYNMCYAEGSMSEIIDVDYDSDFTCLCYMMSYMNEGFEYQSRPINGVIKRILKMLEIIEQKVGNG